MQFVPVRFSRRLRPAATLAVSLLFTACALTPPAKQARAPSPRRPIVVGEVTIVDHAGQFALVDLASNLYAPAPGVALRSINGANHVTAQLKAAAERKRPFIAADIVDGHPSVGDLVVQ